MESSGGVLDKAAIAARLRGLIGGQEQGDLGAIAAKLGVDEVSLRMSVDELAPYPTIDVLAAIVRVYGVDPAWLISGEYNPDTHRSTADLAPERTVDVMREMVQATEVARASGDTPVLRIVREG